MKKQVIILTKSTKYRNYCVAGIERATSEWIRLENKDVAANALTEDDITYEDGTVCQELDIVEVECLEEDANSYFQSENVYIDTGCRMRKIGQSSWQEVLEKHPAEVRHNILGMNGGRISQGYATKRSRNASLQLIKVSNLTIFESELEQDGDYKHPKAKFVYENNSQEEKEYTLTVTDPDYHPATEERRLEEAYLIVSLGVLFEGNHYLLIAKIIESVDEPYYITTSSRTGKKYFHKDDNCGLLKAIGYGERYSSGRIHRDGVSPCNRCES